MKVKARIDEHGVLLCASQVCDESCPHWDKCEWYEMEVGEEDEEDER